MKIVVVTALIGDSESPPPLGPIEPNVRYVCVTDRDVPGWERLPPPDDSPRRAARRVKTSVCERFPSADASIWVDASFTLTATPSGIVAAAKATGKQIVGMRHPDRNRIRDEADVIVKIGLAQELAVRQQLATYQSMGFDTDENPQKCLTTTGLLIRFHNFHVTKFNAAWWEEIDRFTPRDQLSIDFVAKKCGMEIGYLPGNYRDNAFAHYDRRRHIERRVMQ